ncbi:uncharacterized protein LOC121834543 [Ixodes scapularis]|uniref:uncharacterized protein LOC121834543 n=1 Tax=Ixodes scapularis TaxID=6945 RepID=UPI001A9F5094|nr:uncharacterized protein LOC121834543 [Ixodes scapularis]
MDTVATTSHISAAETRQSLQKPQLTAKDINDDVPSKKQCVNLPPEQMDEERTSNYSFHDGTPGDEDDFIQVTVRKNRPAGIPLIIKPKEQGTSFWRINPNRIAKEIVTVSQEKLLAPRIRKDGTITVNTSTLNSTNRLLMMKSLVEIDVTVTVSESYTRNVGKVNNIPVQYSDYELLDYLKNAGVIAVQRQIAYSRKEDGSMEQQPTESVLLHFLQNHPMPARVLLGFTSHPVMEYFGTPVHCFRCQRHGHLARHCRGQQRCKVCAGSHSYKDCMDKTNPKCANCGGNHFTNEQRVLYLYLTDTLVSMVNTKSYAQKDEKQNDAIEDQEMLKTITRPNIFTSLCVESCKFFQSVDGGSSAGLSNTSEARLTYILARSLRVCLGLPRATSSALVLAAAKEPPVTILRIQEVCRNFFRLSARPLFNDILSRKGTNFLRTLNSVPMILPEQTHWVQDIHKPPWTLPLLDINMNIPGMETKASTNTHVARTLTLAHLLQKYDDNIHVYTDGSTKDEGSTSAFVVPQFNHSSSFRLSHHTSSTTAELHALLAAAMYIKNSLTANSWLQSIKTLNTRNENMSLVYRICEELGEAIRFGHTIHLQWVPGHSGVSGNTQADQLATNAYTSNNVQLTPFTKSDAKRYIRCLRNRMSPDTWLKSISEQSLLLLIDPDLRCPVHNYLSRPIETLIHRLRLNVAYTGRFLCRIQQVETPSCTCGHPVEDVEHIIMDCPRYDQWRTRLRVGLSILDSRSFSLAKVLGPWPDLKSQKRASTLLRDFFTDTKIIDRY